MPENENMKLAVLIDADNAQASICAELMAEIAKFGIASVKRAYGDWTTTSLKGWKNLYTNMQYSLFSNSVIPLAEMPPTLR